MTRGAKGLIALPAFRTIQVWPKTWRRRGNTNMGQYVDPPLITVRMPFVEMGKMTARNLMALIGTKALHPTAGLRYELMVRQSVVRQ